MDVNGDSIADVVGFAHDDGDAATGVPASEHRLYCLAGDRGGYSAFHSCRELFDAYANDWPLPSFAPIFADMDGDLGAEIVFAYEPESKKRRLDVWKLKRDEWVFESAFFVKQKLEFPACAGCQIIKSDTRRDEHGESS